MPGAVTTPLDMDQDAAAAASLVLSSLGHCSRAQDPPSPTLTQCANLQVFEELFQAFEQRLEELRQELATNRKTINRLKAIREKMLNVAEPLYTNRAVTISNGVTVLEERLELTQRLIDGYTRLTSILDIEYDTANLAEQLPVDISGKIIEQMEELKRQLAKEKRVVLRIRPELAPIKAAVLPLLRNRSELVERARALTADLKQLVPAMYDDTASIGKLYRRQDEIGTPFCLTVDFDTLTDDAVTIRERDAMTQERVALDQVESYLAARLVGC